MIQQYYALYNFKLEKVFCRDIDGDYFWNDDITQLTLKYSITFLNEFKKALNDKSHDIKAKDIIFFHSAMDTSKEIDYCGFVPIDDNNKLDFLNVFMFIDFLNE